MKGGSGRHLTKEGKKKGGSRVIVRGAAQAWQDRRLTCGSGAEGRALYNVKSIGSSRTETMGILAETDCLWRASDLQQTNPPRYFTNPVDAARIPNRKLGA